MKSKTAPPAIDLDERPGRQEPRGLMTTRTVGPLDGREFMRMLRTLAVADNEPSRAPAEG